MKKILFEVKNLTVTRKNKNLLQDISFSLNYFETLVVIGADGAGKGLLLKTLMGIQEGAISGSISLTTPGKLGLVSNSYACVEGLSLFENLALTLRLMGVHSRAFLGEEVEEVLRTVDLWSEVKHNLHEDVKSLSTFQKIRLNLARTLLLKPEVLLLDKPTQQNIDSIKQAHYEAIIEHLKPRVSVIWVSHDLEQAARVSDKILFLKEGRMVECGSSEDIFTKPTNPETESFISRRMNV